MGGLNPFNVDGSCSSDVESADAALTYSWDWTGDGTPDDTGTLQTHDYTAAAKNVAALRVTDADGRSSVTQHTLIVENDASFGCVTTTVDEEDAGATPAAPGGVGFSLREAINWATTLAGRQTVCFDAGLAGQTIAFTRGVLPILPLAGIQIAGRRDVTIDFGALPYGFRTQIDSDLFNLRLTGVAAGGVAKIVIGGNSVNIERCEIFGGGGAGIAWDEVLSSGPGTDLDIVDSDIHDNETDGIRIAPVVANDVEAEILRNRIWDNGGIGIDASRIGLTTTLGRNVVSGNGSHGLSAGADDGDIVNNTVAFNGGDGIRFLDCGCGTNNRFWNNLVFDNAGRGLVAVGVNGKGDSNGKNYVFGNDLGEVLGANVNLQGDDEVGTLDPLLEADFELARTSPCRNTGRNMAGTPDANGRDTGIFYGSSFDVGAWESPR